MKSAYVIYEWSQREADESVLSAETSSSSGLGKEEKPSKYRLIDASKYYIVEEDVSDDEDIDPKHYQTSTYQRSVNCKVSSKAKLFQEAMLFIIIFTIPEVNVQVQNYHEVHSRLLLCLSKCMKLGCQILHGHFEPVYLLQVSKNDEKCCFLQ